MADRIGIPTVVSLLRDVGQQIADDYTSRQTGRTWRRPDRRCPDWCAQDHTCTARHGYPSGEHRSPPTVWAMPWGGLTATRVAPVGRSPYLELRLSVELAADGSALSLDQSCWLPIAINEAVTATLAELAARHQLTNHPVRSIP